MSAVTGSVRIWLRVEGLAALVAAVFSYREQSASWLMFAILFLMPDLSMLGYLAGPRVGATVYNLAHSYVLPAALLVAALLTKRSLAASVGLIWMAHIGFDRMLGYGLKYASAFVDTHFGRIGKQKAASAVSL